MVFTKNDIMLESTCMGDIAQISVACDLMMESFVDGSDEDTFEEAGGKVFDSIKSAASAIIEKIKKFITDSIRSIKDKMDKKKIENAIKTLKEFDMKKAEKEFKIRKGPDVLKAYDLLMKYEDMVDKYIGQLDTSFENMTDRQKMTKLVKFSEEVDKNCNKILGEIETTLTSPDKQIVYNPKRYEAILRLGLNIDGNYEQFGARITTATDKLNAKINETFRMIGESVELTLEAFGRKKQEPEPEPTRKDKLLNAASDIKSGLMNQLHTLQGFIVKHKKAVIAITSAVVVTATGILIYKNTGKSGSVTAVSSPVTKSGGGSSNVEIFKGDVVNTNEYIAKNTRSKVTSSGSSKGEVVPVKVSTSALPKKKLAGKKQKGIDQKSTPSLEFNPLRFNRATAAKAFEKDYKG